MPNTKEEQNKNLKEKNKKQQKKNNKKRKVYLSAVTLILLILVGQVAYSALYNISKIVVYRTKIAKSQELKEQAEIKNKQLKNEIENFNSMNRVESIARNNLKMAGENEVLVIINTPEKEEEPKSPLQQFSEFFEKNVARRFLPSENTNNLIITQ